MGYQCGVLRSGDVAGKGQRAGFCAGLDDPFQLVGIGINSSLPELGLDTHSFGLETNGRHITVRPERGNYLRRIKDFLRSRANLTGAEQGGQPLGHVPVDPIVHLLKRLSDIHPLLVLLVVHQHDVVEVTTPPFKAPQRVGQVQSLLLRRHVGSGGQQAQGIHRLVVGLLQFLRQDTRPTGPGSSAQSPGNPESLRVKPAVLDVDHIHHLGHGFLGDVRRHLNVTANPTSLVLVSANQHLFRDVVQVCQVCFFSVDGDGFVKFPV